MIQFDYEFSICFWGTYYISNSDVWDLLDCYYIYYMVPQNIISQIFHMIQFKSTIYLYVIINYKSIYYIIKYKHSKSRTHFSLKLHVI